MDLYTDIVKKRRQESGEIVNSVGDDKDSNRNNQNCDEFSSPASTLYLHSLLFDSSVNVPIKGALIKRKSTSY